MVCDATKEGSLYRKVADASPCLYAPIAEDWDNPTFDEMNRFLKYFYPLQKADAAELERQGYIRKQNGRIYINRKEILPIEKRLEQSDTENIKYFYRIIRDGIEPWQFTQKSQNDHDEKLSEMGWEELDLNIEFYENTLDDDEDISKISRYKIEQTGENVITLREDSEGNEIALIEARLYITSYFEEELYVDISAIEEVEFTGKILHTDRVEKGMLIYNDSEPVSFIKEGEMIQADTEQVRNIYTVYKNLVSSGTAAEEKLVEIGGKRKIVLKNKGDLKFKIERLEEYANNSAHTEGQEIRRGAVLGHMARQGDREYADISIFTFEENVFNCEVWKIPAGTYIYTRAEETGTAGAEDSWYNLRYLETTKNNVYQLSQPQEVRRNFFQRRYYFTYKGKSCCVENRGCVKEQWFTEVKIDDRDSLITGRFEIYNVKKEKSENYTWKRLVKLLQNEEREQTGEISESGLWESLRRARIVKPLEFDRTKTGDDFVRQLERYGIAFSQDTESAEIQDIYGKLQRETGDFHNRENRFCFYHPVMFIASVNQIVSFDFNPYERYEVSPPFSMKNNPGFMPEGTTSDSFSQEFNAHVSVTYSHEGVDIAVPNAAIISGISGTVIVEGDKGNYSYGCFIVIQAKVKYEGKYRYYLLAHLDRTKEHKHEGEDVYPNDIIGYVGNTGHCISGSYNIEGEENLSLRKDGRGAHLHLQMFLREDEHAGFITAMEFDTLKDVKTKRAGIQCQNRGIVNPFNYSETYAKDTEI